MSEEASAAAPEATPPAAAPAAAPAGEEAAAAPAAENGAAEGGTPEGEEAVTSSTLAPCVDLTSTHLKIDHFEMMHGLGEDKKVEGAPNFRQVSFSGRKILFFWKNINF